MIPTIIHKSMRQLTALVAVLLSLACVFSCKKEKGGGDALEKIYFVDPASATMVIPKAVPNRLSMPPFLKRQPTLQLWNGPLMTRQ